MKVESEGNIQSVVAVMSKVHEDMEQYLFACMQYGAFEDGSHIVLIEEYASMVRSLPSLCVHSLHLSCSCCQYGLSVGQAPLICTL